MFNNASIEQSIRIIEIERRQREQYAEQQRKQQRILKEQRNEA